MTAPPIFVVSLERETERRDFMRSQLASLSLDFQIFDAVDGSRLDEGDYRDRWQGDWWKVMRGRELSPGEIGCFLSHYALWKRMVATGEEHAVIMEDDVIVGQGYSDVVRAVLGCGWKWDIVLLSPRKRYPTDCVLCQLDDSGRSLVRFRRRVGGCLAYLIHIDAARVLLDYCRNIRAPIDWMYAEWWRNGLSFYGTDPAVVSHRKSPSTIRTLPKVGRTFDEHAIALLYRIMDWRWRARSRRLHSPERLAGNGGAPV